MLNKSVSVVHDGILSIFEVAAKFGNPSWKYMKLL